MKQQYNELAVDPLGNMTPYFFPSTGRNNGGTADSGFQYWPENSIDWPELHNDHAYNVTSAVIQSFRLECLFCLFFLVLGHLSLSPLEHAVDFIIKAK